MTRIRASTTRGRRHRAATRFHATAFDRDDQVDPRIPHDRLTAAARGEPIDERWPHCIASGHLGRVDGMIRASLRQKDPRG